LQPGDTIIIPNPSSDPPVKMHRLTRIVGLAAMISACGPPDIVMMSRGNAPIRRRRRATATRFSGLLALLHALGRGAGER